MRQVALAAILGLWTGPSGDVLAQADQLPRLLFRVTGEPRANQWQATVIRVAGHTVRLTGTELEHPGLSLQGSLEASGSELWVWICDHRWRLEPTDAISPTQLHRGTEPRPEAPAASALGDSGGPKWRRVGYEFSIAPLRPGNYTLAIAACSLEDEHGGIVAEIHPITVP
jgi:hypothetical protein